MTGDDLRSKREVLGLSQADLAAALDVRRQTITEWETGTRAIRLGRILELALEALAREREERGEVTAA